MLMHLWFQDNLYTAVRFSIEDPIAVLRLLERQSVGDNIAGVELSFYIAPGCLNGVEVADGLRGCNQRTHRPAAGHFF